MKTLLFALPVLFTMTAFSYIGFSISSLLARFKIIGSIDILPCGVIGAIAGLVGGIVMCRELTARGLKRQELESKEPNQALEPTSTAVTPSPAGKPPASAGDRASGARGSS